MISFALITMVVGYRFVPRENSSPSPRHGDAQVGHNPLCLYSLALEGEAGRPGRADALPASSVPSPTRLFLGAKFERGGLGNDVMLLVSVSASARRLRAARGLRIKAATMTTASKT